MYGVITLCGPSLHAITGMEHARAASSSSEDEHTSALPASHDDCSICHFLGQMQCSVEPARALSLDVVRIQPADNLPLTFPPAIEPPAGPRAPPSLLSA
jgi:hypothetical protein